MEQSWTESIWEQIFTEVYNRYRQTTATGKIRFDQAQIGAVIKYIEGMDLLDDPKERRKVETHLLRRAKEEINNILDRHKLKCYVLFDSMEDYPVKNRTFLKVVGGFLRALARFEIQCPNACIVFALPEEIRPILFRLSSNKLKDFESRIELRWRARDRLRMVAHRYRLFLRLHDLDWYSHVRHIDFAQARGRQEFFQSLFPVPVTNEFGDQEEPVAYILRHTQLLPRHLLIFLNEIARVSHAKAGGWRRIDPEFIVQGIRNVEEDVVGEILAPYGFLYEDIGNKLKTDLSTLPPIFSYGDLDAVVNRMRRRLGFDDHFSVWEMLFLIGVIGKIKKEPPVTNPHGVSYISPNFITTIRGRSRFLRTRCTAFTRCSPAMYQRYRTAAGTEISSIPERRRWKSIRRETRASDCALKRRRGAFLRRVRELYGRPALDQSIWCVGGGDWSVGSFEGCPT